MSLNIHYELDVNSGRSDLIVFGHTYGVVPRPSAVFYRLGTPVVIEDVGLFNVEHVLEQIACAMNFENTTLGHLVLQTDLSFSL